MHFEQANILSEEFCEKMEEEELNKMALLQEV